MKALPFIVGCLATYRLTVLFARDAGPLDAMKRLRSVTRFTKLLSCPFCVSVWIGAVVALALYFCREIETGVLTLFVALSFSAVAIMLDKAFTSDYRT